MCEQWQRNVNRLQNEKAPAVMSIRRGLRSNNECYRRSCRKRSINASASSRSERRRLEKGAKTARHATSTAALDCHHFHGEDATGGSSSVGEPAITVGSGATASSVTSVISVSRGTYTEVTTVTVSKIEVKSSSVETTGVDSVPRTTTVSSSTRAGVSTGADSGSSAGLFSVFPDFASGSTEPK